MSCLKWVNFSQLIAVQLKYISMIKIQVFKSYTKVNRKQMFDLLIVY